MKQTTLFVLILSAMAYLGCIFIEFEFNPVHWHPLTRATFVLFLLYGVGLEILKKR